MAELGLFRDPASVAVVGASDDRGKWGYWLARGALSGRHRRKVYLVNRSTSSVQGESTYPDVASLPEPPELLVLCVPPAFVEGVVDEALALGVRAFLGITAGVANEARLGSKIRAAGARIVGPNSLGLYDATSQLQLAWGHFTPGSLAIVSQSGQLGSEIATMSARAGLGVSRFVSVGNQLDVHAAELLEDLLDHGASSLVALYLESFTDGPQLVEVLQRLRAAGKPTVVLTTGASEGSQRLAQSHTGSLTSALDTVDAACRAAGAIRVATPTELVDVARCLAVSARPTGRRVAVVSDSGGQGGIAADVAAARGLSTPVFSVPLQERLATMLPAGASVSNPVDLAGAGEADLHTYAVLTELLMTSGEVDTVLLSGYLGCYGEDNPATERAELAVVDRLGSAVASAGVPLLVHSMSPDSPAVRRMWNQGIPVFAAIESGMGAIANAAALSQWPGRELDAAAGAPLTVQPDYWAARDVLSRIGIDAPAGRRVDSPEQVAAAAAELTPPLVLKAGWLAHKSESGGVRLGLRTAAELAAAYEDMVTRLGAGEYVVEEQDTRPDVVEMLVGGRRDRDFGPLIAVGAGGTEAELYRDVCVELAPVDHATALDMVSRLRCLPLLRGWRGRPPVDLAALADVVVAVSCAVAATPEIDDLEVNPLRVGPAGALAVDALILSTGDTDEAP
ncbi:acetate--CoA ligase family protein [Blastococcus sp. BMG 814]|uniref:Acetate--CoA ligase family protein n=1 Tax=Blastococcus carthaginiensis TaxID=3050034 RepID=A0ABT9IA85_9ACTN|nr:acetate--CoA ligase family protein [Blastococcus carthaginiensis]MDP5182020.1 acetate--CoA ligase family protein [Blastococcus carthaginiensis]